jgi:hypothetical protein
MAPDRRFVVSGSVSKPEQREIYRALDAAGFASRSAGVREILLAFAQQETVRAAVRAARGEPGASQ